MPSLLVSFLGETDLELTGLPRRPEAARTPAPGERSPLLRVVDDLIQRNLFGRDGAILILDDRKLRGDDRGARYCANLANYVRTLLDEQGIPVTAHPIDLGDPTDLDRLHREVVEVIKSAAAPHSKVLINLSSGTPAMHTSLVLAASYLPLKQPRFFESAKSGEVLEIRLPYMVYVRRHIDVDRAPNRAARVALKTRPPLEGIKLPPFTAVGDAAVATLLAAVAKARRTPRPILIVGPCGSGKTWAAMAAAFNADLPVTLIDAEFVDALPPMFAAHDGNVIVKHLELAGDRLLGEIGVALDAHPGVRWTTTLRTDRAPRNAGLPAYVALRRRLAAGGEFLMPPPGRRNDVVELAELMFKETGQWATKVKERFQYELATAELADGLHALRRRVACAAALSPTRHTDEAAFRAAAKSVEAIDAAAVLQQAAAALAGGGWGIPVSHLLQVVEHATQRIGEASNPTQAELADQLGYPNRTTCANRRAASADAYRQFVERFMPAPG